MKVIITGGAGFIGSNAAARYIRRGDRVVVLDNLSRPGSEKNFGWLKEQGQFEFHQVDIRDGSRVEEIFQAHPDTSLVLHLAGQVAVTASVLHPRADFEANALGAINVLEAMRKLRMAALLIYASTNKVYGRCENVPVIEVNDRYAFMNHPNGISETHNLDFHSPYGCSKGSADQYVRDYHRIYGLNTIVFRQSSIYGYRQFGLEDQGWVAWFMIASQLGRGVSIYGNGKQVRDILFIDDLLDAFDLARESAGACSGKVFNIGGGTANALSLLDLLAYIENRLGKSLRTHFEEWRPGDQRIYVSDIGLAERELGWKPTISKQKGLDLLFDWIAKNLHLFDVTKQEG